MTLCLARILLALGGALSGLPVIAQGLPPYQIYRDSVEIVSVNRDRLIQSSEFGKALVNVLTTRQRQLVEENASLALDLEILVRILPHYVSIPLLGGRRLLRVLLLILLEVSMWRW